MIDELNQLYCKKDFGLIFSKDEKLQNKFIHPLAGTPFLLLEIQH
jgi:hypothetical protein